MLARGRWSTALLQAAGRRDGSETRTETSPSHTTNACTEIGTLLSTTHLDRTFLANLYVLVILATMPRIGPSSCSAYRDSKPVPLASSYRITYIARPCLVVPV